jgi:hypothetical protein
VIKGIIRLLLNRFGYDVVRYSNERLWPVESNAAQTFYEMDKSYHEIYDRAQDCTEMTHSENPLRRLRHYTLQQLMSNVNLESGDVCELGCFRGLSAYQIAHHISKSGKKVDFHVFDSFEGLSELHSVDMPKDRSQDVESLRKQFSASLETVKDNLKDFDFINYYKGWIPDRFHEVRDRLFCFVHVDVDLYQPTYHAVQFFYPRLVKDGIMVFDDYGCTQFPGAKKAVDESLEKNNDFFMPLPSGQAFLIKR